VSPILPVHTSGLPGGYVLTGSSNGQITLTGPGGASINSTPGGGTTLTLPGGTAVTVSSSGAVSMSVPGGTGALVQNAIDELGRLLGIDLGGGNIHGQVIPVGSQPTQGAWEDIRNIVLGNRPPGIYDIATTSDTRGVPESPTPPAPSNIIFIRLTVQPPPPKITRDPSDDGESLYKLIEGQVAKALPGQRIDLRLEIHGDSVPTDIVWDIQGRIFKDYTETNALGKVTQVSASDLNGTGVIFYWADAGEKAISVSFKVNGQTKTVTAVVDVLQPLVTITTNIGATGFTPAHQGATHPAGTRVGLFPNVNSPDDGITFTGTVTMPIEFTGLGEWRWIQILTPSRSFTDVDGNNWNIAYQGVKVLDGTLPYAPKVLNPTIDVPYYTIYSGASSGPFTTSDSPSQPFRGYIHNQPLTSLWFKSVRIIDERLSMYLMFKPTGNQSRFVPLKIMNWGWSISATKQGSNWTLDPATWHLNWTIDPGTAAQFLEQPVDVSIHPEWTAYFQGEGNVPQ